MESGNLEGTSSVEQTKGNKKMNMDGPGKLTPEEESEQECLRRLYGEGYDEKARLAREGPGEGIFRVGKSRGHQGGIRVVKRRKHSRVDVDEGGLSKLATLDINSTAP